MSLTWVRRDAMRRQIEQGRLRHEVFMAKLHPDRGTPLERGLLLGIQSIGLWVNPAQETKRKAVQARVQQQMADEKAEAAEAARHQHKPTGTGWA